MMTNKKSEIINHETSNLYSLPKIVTTKSGIEFNPNDDIWLYREMSLSINLNFHSINHITPQLRNSLKSVLIWYAENRSGEFLENLFYHFRHLCKSIAKNHSEPISSISSNDLLNYYSSLEVRKKWYLSSIAGLIKKWYEFGSPGINKDAKELLSKIRLKGNQKGIAVQTQDPNYGAFSEVELQAIGNSLNDAFAFGKIELWEYLMVWLFMLFGLRPAQLAALQLNDVSQNKNADQTICYHIKIPRAKQRNSTARSDFKIRLIIPQIGKLLVKHAAETSQKFGKIFANKAEIPLFPDTKALTTSIQVKNSFHLKSLSRGTCKTVA